VYNSLSYCLISIFFFAKVCYTITHIWFKNLFFLHNGNIQKTAMSHLTPVPSSPGLPYNVKDVTIKSGYAVWSFEYKQHSVEAKHGFDGTFFDLIRL
jgi:hypothetical protein